jgi:hypothetical protein
MSVSLPSTEHGVPHISLVFREMWDTTNLNLFSDSPQVSFALTLLRQTFRPAPAV